MSFVLFLFGQHVIPLYFVEGTKCHDLIQAYFYRPVLLLGNQFFDAVKGVLGGLPLVAVNTIRICCILGYQVLQIYDRFGMVITPPVSLETRCPNLYCLILPGDDGSLLGQTENYWFQMSFGLEKTPPFDSNTFQCNLPYSNIPIILALVWILVDQGVLEYNDHSFDNSGTT